jgi:cytochrome c-type biogenesis protein CcmE
MIFFLCVGNIFIYIYIYICIYQLNVLMDLLYTASKIQWAGHKKQKIRFKKNC